MLPTSGKLVFLLDTSLLCISIPNSDCLFPLSFDQVVKLPSRPSPGPAGLTRGLTVTAYRPNQNPACETKGKLKKDYKAQTIAAAMCRAALSVPGSTAEVPKGLHRTQQGQLFEVSCVNGIMQAWTASETVG